MYILAKMRFEKLMRKLALLIAGGLALGNLLSTYFGPDLLTWWFESPVNMAVNCTDPIQWAMHKLIILQLVGSGIGIVLGAFVFFVFFKKSRTV